MADAFAVSGDLQDRWRPLTDEESERADVLLEDASRIVRRRVTDVDARIASGALDVYDLVMVVCGMVKRAMLAEGRDGVTQTSDTAGPYAQTTSYANPTGSLYLSKNELASLTGWQRGAFTIDTGPAATPFPAYMPPPWPGY